MWLAARLLVCVLVFPLLWSKAPAAAPEKRSFVEQLQNSDGGSGWSAWATGTAVCTAALRLCLCFALHVHWVPLRGVGGGRTHLLRIPESRVSILCQGPAVCPAGMERRERAAQLPDESAP